MIRNPRRPALITLPLAAILLLSGCTPSVDEEDWFGTAAGDDTPIEDRQYIDDYATDIVPAILDFLDELSTAGAGEWNNGEEPPWFSTLMCYHPDDRQPEPYGTSLNGMKGAPIPPEAVAEVGDGIFPQLGFAPAETSEVSNLIYVVWLDWYNGGYIRASFGHNRTYVEADSECRYARDIEATRQHIQELAPRPNDSPTPPGTPSPTPGSTRSRWAREHAHGGGRAGHRHRLPSSG
ncbi:MAG: hypothetical protein Q4E05_02915 [Pseudoclavibacter sp.]|nr:hypothetical protein [Pseudoclavibacter sp.]